MFDVIKKTALRYYTIFQHGERPGVRVARYIFSGGTAATVNLAALYALVDFFGLYYLTGAVLSFIIAFVVSFLLQKFWTFRNFEKKTDVVQKQVVWYFGIALFNLCLNTTFIYFFVEVLYVWYMLAQFISSGLIAVLSYFLYKLFVFGNNNNLKIKNQNEK
jgi:putative flippase GtrA